MWLYLVLTRKLHSHLADLIYGSVPVFFKGLFERLEQCILSRTKIQGHSIGRVHIYESECTVETWHHVIFDALHRLSCRRT